MYIIETIYDKPELEVMSACLHMRSQRSFPALSSTPPVYAEVAFGFRNTELNMSIGQVGPYRDRMCMFCASHCQYIGCTSRA